MTTEIRDTSGRFTKGDKVKYESGDRYGFLTLTGKCFMMLYGGCDRRFVEVICQCGKIYFTNFQSLRSGAVKSCGCHKNKILFQRNIIHGMAVRGNIHPIYHSYSGMMSRCYNENDINFKNYGGRGIFVCEEWKNSFISFKNWALENGWEEGLTLDRKDNEFGIYKPSNCAWKTYPEQARNKRTNIWVTAFGETKCLKDWQTDTRCKVAPSTLFYRIVIIKWGAEDAITIPPLTKNRK